MQAIVFVSNTGFTKKYAEYLAIETDVQEYDLKKAEHELKKGTEIIFLGWIRGGTIVGLKKARKKFCVKMAIGVGMTPPSEKMLISLIKANKTKGIPTFYLQGGLDKTKLKKVQRLLLRLVTKVVRRMVKNNVENNQEAIAMLHVLEKGGNFVAIKNLESILEYLNA